MFRSRRRAVPAIMIAGLALVATACSETGGGGGGGGGGGEDSPRRTFAMITHAAAGDTFFDIVRKGADAAAKKNNVDLKYSSDPDSNKQANLLQGAIDSKVDGIAVAISDPSAINPVVQKAVDAGIPVVAFNQGFNDYQKGGALSYFGSNEQVAGEEAGKRAAESGAKHILCVPQAQGSVALETRCNGVEKGFTAAGGKYTKIYVNQLDMPSVRTTISAKLRQDPSIDYVITLGAPIALTAIDALKDAGSSAKLATFDSNPQIIDPVKNDDVQFLIDQQPWLQGYLAVDSLWLFHTNANIVGGGLPVPTGPYVIDKSTIDAFAEFAAGGTR